MSDSPHLMPFEFLARAEKAQARAKAAGERAERAEAVARSAPLAVRTTQLRLAELYRTNEQVHRAAATIHQSLFRMNAALAENPAVDRGGLLVSAGAEALGASSVAMVFMTSDGQQAETQATDVLSGAAQNLELVHAEGPLSEAVDSGCVVASSGADIAQRWPFYGRALNDLGVESLVAAPLRHRGAPFGAVGLFDLAVIATDGLVVQHVADLMAQFLLQAPRETAKAARGEGDSVRPIHQAVGMVAEQLGCDLPTALALIRGRAFSHDVPALAVARDVLAGRLRLEI